MDPDQSCRGTRLAFSCITDGEDHHRSSCPMDFSDASKQALAQRARDRRMVRRDWSPSSMCVPMVYVLEASERLGY